VRVSPQREAKRKKMNSEYGGYNIPATGWMEERRRDFERAFEFAREEREAER
jgi:hypothetical protein